MVREIAERQHGLISRTQLSDLGYPTSSLANALADGRLDKLSDRVLRVGGSAHTIDQRTMAAALDVPGGAVGIFSAAALWELSSFSLEPFHTMTHRRPHRGGVHLSRMHTSTSFGPNDVTSIRGIPTTTPLRTLLDLAGRIHYDRLDLVCDRMLSKRLIRIEALHALAASLPSRGGGERSRDVRRLVGTRGDDYRPPESNLERRFELVVRRSGDLPFERQVDLGDGDGWIGRVDYVDRGLRVVVEIQSDLFHAGRVDCERDALRFERLRRAGWIVVPITEFEVWHRDELVLGKVRSARAAGARLVALGGSPRPTDGTT
jgi:very-short-patch-repair endonuclease